jgi:hypothetical protein
MLTHPQMSEMVRLLEKGLDSRNMIIGIMCFRNDQLQQHRMILFMEISTNNRNLIISHFDREKVLRYINWFKYSIELLNFQSDIKR